MTATEQALAKHKQRWFLPMTQTILALCLAVLVIFQSVISCCFDLAFYKRNFRELNTAQQVDVSEAALEQGISVLLDYLNGLRNDIKLTVRLTSTKQLVEMYNQREKAHMLDVRALYQLLLRLRLALLIVSMLLICLLFRLYLFNDYRYFWQSLRASALYSLLIIAMFVLVIAYAVAHDFDSFWWHFHELLFTNDLWQLDPASSRMINLVDGQFFANLVHYILRKVAYGLLALYAVLLGFPSLCLGLLKRWNKII